MWRSRAKAAEAEVERLTDCLETQYEINRNTARAACEARGDHFDAEDRIEELEAEVARLTQRDHREIDGCCSKQKAELRTRIAELEAELLGAMREKEDVRRTATEDALKYSYNELSDVREASDRGAFISRAIKALLGEDGDA